MSFDTAFTTTVGIEGQYSNNPLDKGGPTMYGITERVARANGYNDEMASMPLSVAKTIYRRQYWDALKLDDVNAIDIGLAAELFDQGVNHGTSIPAKFLQRLLNVLNRRGTVYGDMVVDGVLGAVTIHGLETLVAVRGSQALSALKKGLIALEGNLFIELAEHDPSQEEFELGWLSKRL